MTHDEYLYKNIIERLSEEENDYKDIIPISEKAQACRIANLLRNSGYGVTIVEYEDFYLLETEKP